MTIRGHVHNGVVVPDENGALPEGAAVEIVLIEREPSREPDVAQPREGESIWDFLDRWAGQAKGLPADFAENHDHYIHGTPKRT